MSAPLESSSPTLTGHDRPGDPCIFVIFGASGDLAKRLLLPALYNLKALKLLPSEFALVGVDFKAGDDESFREQFTSDIHEFATRPVDPAEWEDFRRRLHYIQGDFSDPGLFDRIRNSLPAVDKDCSTKSNVLFYLAVAPRFFGPIATALGKAGLLQQGPDKWRRVIIEKPFGHDLDSARELTNTLKAHLSEDQIYPIDHFTGKETVQNILAFRFANEIFEPLLNRNSVDYIQITAAESLGVEKRGGYYDHSGATRDMLQNHVLSVLCLVGMDAPTSIAGEAVRNEKLRVLQAIKPMSEEEIQRRCVRGQYGPGRIADTSVTGYRSEPDVDPHSNTETYSAMKLFVENWRWAGVPFYIRSGKRMPHKVTTVVVHFKPAPLLLFGPDPLNGGGGQTQLVIRIAPDEGFGFTVRAKLPGPKMKLKTVPMRFNYEQFGERTKATGYETLLYDCMVGDPTLFHRSDIIDASWRIMTPVLQYWEANPAQNFPNYAAGSWGPEAANDLLSRSGHEWRSGID